MRRSPCAVPVGARLDLSNLPGASFRPVCDGYAFRGSSPGKALYLNIDRDVDFATKTITVRGAVSFSTGNQATVSPGKTEAAQRVIPFGRAA